MTLRCSLPGIPLPLKPEQVSLSAVCRKHAPDVVCICLMGRTRQLPLLPFGALMEKLITSSSTDARTHRCCVAWSFPHQCLLKRFSPTSTLGVSLMALALSFRRSRQGAARPTMLSDLWWHRVWRRMTFLCNEEDKSYRRLAFQCSRTTRARGEGCRKESWRRGLLACGAFTDAWSRATTRISTLTSALRQLLMRRATSCLKPSFMSRGCGSLDNYFDILKMVSSHLSRPICRPVVATPGGLVCKRQSNGSQFRQAGPRWSMGSWPFRHLNNLLFQPRT